MHLSPGLLFNPKSALTLTPKLYPEEEDTYVLLTEPQVVCITAAGGLERFFQCGELWSLQSQDAAYFCGMFGVCLAGLG